MTYPDIVAVAAATTARDASTGVSAFGQHNAIRLAIVDLDERVSTLERPWQFVAGPGENDYATVQAAIDACHTAYLADGSRGEVFVSGVFTGAKLTVKQGVARLTGIPDYSKYTLSAGQNTATLTTDGFVTTDTTGGLYGFTFDNLIIDGNGANQSSNADTATVQIHGYNYRLNGLHIRNAKTWGIYSNWSSSSDPPGPENRGMQCQWDWVEVTGFGTGGVNFMGPHDSILSNVFAHALTGSGLTGIRLGARAYGTKLTGSHAYGNGLDYPLDIEGTGTGSDSVTGIQVEHGQWEGGQLAQIRAKWTRGLDLRGNKVYAAGTIAAPVGLLLDASDQCLSIGNRFENLTSGTYKFASDVGGHTLMDKIYQNSGAIVDGTPGSSTKIEPLDVHGATTAAPGSAVTVASGILTFPWGATFTFVNGEGSASDTVTNVRPTGRTGSRITFLANHELTFSHAAGGDGQVLTPDGLDFVVAQFRVVTMILVESSPDTWVIEAVA